MIKLFDRISTVIPSEFDVNGNEIGGLNAFNESIMSYVSAQVEAKSFTEYTKEYYLGWGKNYNNPENPRDDSEPLRFKDKFISDATGLLSYHLIILLNTDSFHDLIGVDRNLDFVNEDDWNSINPSTKEFIKNFHSNLTSFMVKKMYKEISKALKPAEDELMKKLKDEYFDV